VQLSPGIEALKRRAFEPMEGLRGTAGGQGPGNRYRSDEGHASRGESRERRRQRIRRQGRAGSKPPGGTNPGGGCVRDARPARDRLGSMRCGDAKPQESHRGRTQPARRPTVQTRKTSPRPRGMRGRSSGFAFRQDGQGRPSHGLERGPEGSAEQHRMRYLPCRNALKAGVNVRRGVGARL
jgi:hypothetical protein